MAWTARAHGGAHDWASLGYRWQQNRHLEAFVAVADELPDLECIVIRGDGSEVDLFDADVSESNGRGDSRCGAASRST